MKTEDNKIEGYLTVEIKIDDMKRLVKEAREWEKRENYKYDSDLTALVSDFLVHVYHLGEVVDTDLHIVSADQKLYELWCGTD